MIAYSTRREVGRGIGMNVAGSLRFAQGLPCISAMVRAAGELTPAVPGFRQRPPCFPPHA